MTDLADVATAALRSELRRREEEDRFREWAALQDEAGPCLVCGRSDLALVTWDVVKEHHVLTPKARAMYQESAIPGMPWLPMNPQPHELERCATDWKVTYTWSCGHDRTEWVTRGERTQEVSR